MVESVPQSSEVNLLASQGCWAWPKAVVELFKPRGVNLIVVNSPAEFTQVLRHKRVHATIVDADAGMGQLAALRTIRTDYPRVPCLVLASECGQDIMDHALGMDVFSVIRKPVDMQIFRQQLDRLFVKRYSSHVFA